MTCRVPHPAPQRGFTLIESLIVLTVWSLLMSVIALVAMRQIDRTRRQITLREMRLTEAAIVSWQARTGRPCAAMAELVRAGLLRHPPQDGWRRPLRSARCDRRGLLLYSVGGDGRAHTKDDVLSWARADPRWIAAEAPRRWPRWIFPSLGVLLAAWLLRAALRQSPVRIAV